MHLAEEVLASLCVRSRRAASRLIAGRALFATLTLTLVACSGSASPDDGEAGGSGGDSNHGGSGGNDPMVDPDLPPFKAAPISLRALTRIEYRNSVRDLLGISPSGDVDEVPSQAGFSVVGAANGTLSAGAVDKFQNAAYSAAEALFKDTTLRRAFVGCEPASATDPCIEAFVRRFGGRAFRRPLTDDEVKKYLALVAAVGADFSSPWMGLQFALAAFLQSPAFLYRVELGEPDPADSSRLRYTSYEMASRLSYSLWATTPDAELLAAAEKGELVKSSNVQAQAKRLLADAKARDALARVFFELYKLEELEGVPKDAASYPLFSPALVASMKGEVERTVQDLIFEREGDLRDLFDNRTTFVDANLAKLYGLPAPSGQGFTKITLPDDGARAGIFGFGAWLAHRAKETRSSPTLRGKYIREEILCQHVASAPADVDTNIPEPAANQNITTRQRLTDHLVKPQCRSCHLQIDPLGFGLENFDGIGAYRETERTLTIDASGELDGVAFKNARELASAIKQSPDAESCLVRQLYRFTTSHVESYDEARVIASVTEKWKTGDHRFTALVTAIAASDGFRFASANP